MDITTIVSLWNLTCAMITLMTRLLSNFRAIGERFNTLRPRQNGCHFADDTFKRIFVNENVRILINISLEFVPKGLINNIPALVQIMAWRRPGDKPLSETMMVILPTHIFVTRPQWVKLISRGFEVSWNLPIIHLTPLVNKCPDMQTICTSWLESNSYESVRWIKVRSE